MTKWSLHFNLLFAFRRIIYAAIIVIAYEHPVIQSVGFAIVCCIILTYHLIVRPYAFQVINLIMIYNEISICVVAGMLFLFNNPIESKSQNFLMGWICIGIVVIALLINILYQIYSQFKHWVSFIKKIWFREKKPEPQNNNAGYEFTRDVAQTFKFNDNSVTSRKETETNMVRNV